MKYSSLEITDQQYLIKLNKDEFNLSFIYQLLKRLQTEQLFKSSAFDEDIRSRDLAFDNGTRFDRLSDK